MLGTVCTGALGVGPCAYVSEADEVAGTIPEPTQVLSTRRTTVRMPPPRSKSPIKTFLQSPARRAPSLGPFSSPRRGEIRTTPQLGSRQKPTERRLDFSPSSGNTSRSPLKRQTKTQISSVTALTNGTRLVPGELQPAFTSEEPSDEEVGQENTSFQVMDGGDDEEPYEEADGQGEPILSDNEEALVDSIRPNKRGNASLSQANSPLATKRGAGRPPQRRKPEVEREVEEEQNPPKRQRGRPKNADSASNSMAKTNAAGKKRPLTTKSNRPRDSLANEASPVVVQRGPPRPKHNTGLYIMRRENEANATQTRAGRRTFKPLEYWKGETMEHDIEEVTDGVFLPSVKSILRAEEVVKESSRRGQGRKKGSKATKRVKDESEDEQEVDLTEPWEAEPGRIYGDIREWNPADPTGAEADERDEEIALSSAAIITRDIPGSTFKFAKTLTLPFFGSGMVDLPPGAVKKPKNSRKMQMVFFVFSGRVSVTVNENTFRIGKGGMWQVPRGKKDRLLVFQKKVLTNKPYRQFLQYRKRLRQACANIFLARLRSPSRRAGGVNNSRAGLYKDVN